MVWEEATAPGTRSRRDDIAVVIAGGRDVGQATTRQFGATQACVVAAGRSARKLGIVVPEIQVQGALVCAAGG